MARFEYHSEILEMYPEIQAGVVIGQAANRPSPEDLKGRFLEEQQAVLNGIGDTPLSELDSLSAWRGAFRKFGVNPTKYRSAIEALLRRLTKQGDIPSINALVDIGNLVSIRYQVPVAVFDLDRIAGSIVVRQAEGDESFTPLFVEESEHPEPGEVIFIDGNGLVAARRWCWRQSDQSAARIDTESVIFVTEAHHADGEVTVRQAAADLRELCESILGGEWKTGLVNAANPVFTG
jgi:DNA/RNA-binding domain of Phe-tRNA-synthetase-like protein